MVHLLVGLRLLVHAPEATDCGAPEVGPQTLADGLGQFWMSGAADQLDGSDHVALLPSRLSSPEPSTSRRLRTRAIASRRLSWDPVATTFSRTCGPSFPDTRASSSASPRRVDGHGRSPARCRSPSAAPSAEAACRASPCARASSAEATREKVTLWVLSSTVSLAPTDFTSSARASSRGPALTASEASCRRAP